MKMMDLYEELHSATKATYPLQVSPKMLASLRDILHGNTLDLEPHRILSRDVLDGLEITPEHPYCREEWMQIPPETWAWARDYKRATILDIQKRGVQEPVELFFNNQGLVYFHGYHRLAAALEVGLTSIPARAYLVSEELAQLAEKLFGIYKGDFQYTLYQPVDHPFFTLYPVQAANTHWTEKVATVTRVASVWPGQVIEVGAHFGMLTRELRACGVAAEAIDIDSSYLELQPLFEAIGLAPVPYTRKGIQDLVTESGPVRLVMMGLMHHLMGKMDLWAMMKTKVLPWMQKAVPEMVVEMSLLGNYLGGEGAVIVTTDTEVEAFWNHYGYTSTRLMEGTMQRVTYHVRRLSA